MIALPRADRIGGLALVLVGITLQFTQMGLASIGLNLGLVAAYAVWVTRGTSTGADCERLLPVYLCAVALQCLHLTEEYLTGFQREFPHFFGYEWSDQRFVTFNLLWLAVFILAAVGVHKQMTLAVLIVWFMVIAGDIANGILHLGLVIAMRRYFPGAVTAPAILTVGIVLLRRLLHGSTRIAAPG